MTQVAVYNLYSHVRSSHQVYRFTTDMHNETGALLHRPCVVAIFPLVPLTISLSTTSFTVVLSLSPICTMCSYPLRTILIDLPRTFFDNLSRITIAYLPFIFCCACCIFMPRSN
ncbi:hypothetical protein F5050DRAFT_1461298 [Lentinula boryana]|uniref:Uncharacterized protein n=1 Tax=Lentinula boryana TaxID=40481 RepID=A0ABQ8QF78_9AGAR|nr:hypothetical protein F5050DRAFT_1461298 [Lentinula boryana]